MILGTGRKRGVAEVKYALDRRNYPIFEGCKIYKGRIPREDRIKMDYPRDCRECGDEDAYHGVYRVAATDYYLLGLRVYQRVDSVTFLCLRCLNRYEPWEYPFADLKDAYGQKERTDP